ncbi:PREDICTED: formin-binding protein 4-like [Dinoponera quadriceps]|uniref:Formin-binding protein 4-like n=1 Tax=Dinoponera quadriceps TaxID=609295 RepID=A0A6P3WTB8_DINQU|nr:PREDICTED: formin-binding protein 4-like [Dinoponera quadriceps]XP_014469073.1 PREDICTED: formin-binding protein 4-like [Dinoponera quadriceps]
MKRRQRRPVLTIDKPQSTYHVEHVQSRYKPVNSAQPVQSEAENPLANLLCQYNSDSDTEDPKKDVHKLDDQVNDFLKEIQLIAPEQPACNIAKDPKLTARINSQSTHHTGQQTLWQECYDKTSGYPYYWHIETNEVTWDMPEELRLIRKQSEMESVIKPSVQGPHWVDFSSITYRQSQANIPEGMIPQEVVARNRNRLIHKETAKKCFLESKVETKNESPTKDDDSDDGRIEMITSFGSDGSDSEDNSSDEKKTTILPSELGNSALYLKSSEIGPAFCPAVMQASARNLSRSYKPDSTVNISGSTNQPEQSDESRLIDGNNGSLQGEKEFFTEKKSRKDVTKHNAASKLDVNVSLVPGYGDDSDVEEEVRPKQEMKPLFPIAQDEDYATSTSKDTHEAFAKSSCNVQSFDQSNDGNEDTRETKGDHEKTEEKESKADEDKSKTNIFLEDMQVCGKAFQRKKRIAFDVTSNKIKQNNVYHDNAVQDDNSDLTSSAATLRNIDDGDAEMRNQLCTEGPKECEEAYEETEQCISAKPEEKLGSREESCDTEVPAEHKTAANPAEERTNEEMNDLSQIIMEKLKFLSEGRGSVSAVQTMQIQLQTLSTAWATGSLEENYFQKWLTDTNHELERLEQDAAPAGWLCQWDRSHKRYYYHNTSTGTSQWTYPDTGIAGGTEEMELCTTPPPPESDELSVTGSPGAKKPKEKQAEEMDDNKSDENIAEGRPVDSETTPSQTSDPSPPSRTFEEDPKKGKRKREKFDDRALDMKRKRKERITALDTTQAVNPALESALSYSQAAVSPQTSIPANHANMEPLPPGVDLPDTSYEAATLKGIIYNATSQQSNAIYAPSIADPTIPILSHQPSLLQEPFVHYPTFHQHLHNHTIANKHGGQGTIQFMLGYAPIYSNNKIIAKPPVKAAKESLGSALDSFYNDIARIERTETERATQHQDTATMEQAPVLEEVKLPETEPESVPCDTTMKEKKKRKSRISISKKHKEVSTMVAKWQRVQKNLEDTV